MRKPKEQDKVYGGRLAAFGDARLDEMVLAASVPKARAAKPKLDIPSQCPGCGTVALLTKGHVALLCQACHDDITERARKKEGLSYEPSFVGY